MTPLSFCPVNWAITCAVWVIWDVLGQGCSQKVVYHLPLAHFPPMFLTHLPPVDEPFTPYV